MEGRGTGSRRSFAFTYLRGLVPNSGLPAKEPSPPTRGPGCRHVLLRCGPTMETPWGLFRGGLGLPFLSTGKPNVPWDSYSHGLITFFPVLRTCVDFNFPFPVPSGPPTSGLHGLVTYPSEKERETRYRFVPGARRNAECPESPEQSPPGSGRRLLPPTSARAVGRCSHASPQTGRLAAALRRLMRGLRVARGARQSAFVSSSYDVWRCRCRA